MTVRVAAPDEPLTNDVDMTTSLGRFELPNPVLTASGCAAAGQELAQFFDIAELGGIVTKSIMLRPRSGRATPRMAETPSGMLNSIGLQGPGIDAFLEKDLPWLVDNGARAVVSIAGSSIDDYAKLANRIRDAGGASMIEVNISCPNVEDRGQVFACDARAAANVVQVVRRSGQRNLHRGGAGLTHVKNSKGPGFVYGAVEALAAPFVALQGGQDQVCNPAATDAFIAGIKGASVIDLPKVGHGFSVPKIVAVGERWVNEHPATADAKTTARIRVRKRTATRGRRVVELSVCLI